MFRSTIFPTIRHILKTYMLERQRKPFLVSFKPTYRCNLRCLQCPFYNLGGQDLPFNNACDLLERLYQRGNRLLILEGGEPMLWRDGSHTIYDLVAEAKKRFYCVGMTTNGTLPLDAPVDVLWVSIDGFATTHDRLRGAVVYDRIMRNIRDSQHPNIYAHITINNQNHTEIPDLVRFLSGLVKGITVQFYYPYNRHDELFLDFERRAVLLDRLIALKQAGFPLRNSLSSLQVLRHNSWRCVDWLVDSANPDGTISQGCYLRGRSDIDCARCGFSPYTEISLAYQGNLQAVLAGVRIFFND
jgi:MoaA/NifB/PqqE/SkfB family radical SAM enzyme